MRICWFTHKDITHSDTHAHTDRGVGTCMHTHIHATLSRCIDTCSCFGQAAKRSESLKLQEGKVGGAWSGPGVHGAELNRVASGRDWRLSALIPSSLLRSVFSEWYQAESGSDKPLASRPGDSIKRLDVGGQELTSCQTRAIANGTVVAKMETK